MNEHTHLSLTIPSPKNHPKSSPYQRLKYSTNENVHQMKKQTDVLNNNSNIADNSYIPSPSTPSYKFDCENNNVQTNKNSSFLNELKSVPMTLLEKNSGFNSGHLISGQSQQAYPSSVLCMKQNSKQINIHYPNCIKTNKTSTNLPSIHSPIATTPASSSSSSSSSVVNSLPDQPSVLLVVYPVPFVNETNGKSFNSV